MVLPIQYQPDDYTSSLYYKSFKFKGLEKQTLPPYLDMEVFVLRMNSDMMIGEQLQLI